jgi:predicted enzyme related to lactoylglutathione lyase
MRRVTGIGGIFFKARDPKALAEWYRVHLGLQPEDWGGVAFGWADDNPSGKGTTIWSPFPADTKYFEPSSSSFMINFRVADLRALIAALKAEGCKVEGDIQESEYGRFGWVVDPEGNKIELWEPPAGQ